tara:strand:- start:2218 stop:2469 length:252 start_codon:yes stop_codon:yes gene_type:complete
MPVLFVLDVAEFAPVIAAVKNQPGVTISGPAGGYWRAESDSTIALNRKKSGIRLALWYSSLMGGYAGHIKQFDRDDIVIADPG